jgi:hypothetical protein
MENKNGSGDETQTLGSKLLGVAAVLIAAFFLFKYVVLGIFYLVMNGNPENGVYILFYGGAVVLLVLAGLGLASSGLLWRRVKGGAKPATGARPQSALSRGITIGLAAVALIVLFVAVLFTWITYALRN